MSWAKRSRLPEVRAPSAAEPASVFRKLRREVGVVFNQGNFPAGSTVYFFVVDENGAPSEEGYEVTLGSSEDGPGRPGKPYPN